MKLDYENLYSQHGLKELHECFLQFVKAKNSNFDFSLIETAEYLEEFLGQQFGLEHALRAVYKHVSDHSLIAYAKRQFIQRHALKTFQNPEDDWRHLYTFSDAAAFAKAACDALENSKITLDDLSKYASWAALTPLGKQKHKDDSLFHVSEKIDSVFCFRKCSKKPIPV